MKRFVCWGLVASLPLLGCSFGGPDVVSRVAIALSGQLDPEDIDRVDVYVYEQSRVTCDSSSGSIAGDTSVTVQEALGVSLAAGAVDLTLPASSYVVYVEAGLGSGAGALEQPAAQGCATVDLSGDRTLEILLFPYGNCGDGVVDAHEQCDDDTEACERCTTVPLWANGTDAFLSGDQSQPRAAGSGDQLLACWRSDSPDSYQLPMALYDHAGRDLTTNPFGQTDAAFRRDCHSIDLRAGYAVAAYAQDDGDLLNYPFYLSLWEGVSTTPSKSGGFGSTGDPPVNVVVIFTGNAFGVLAAEETEQIHLYSFRVAGAELDVVRQNDVRFTTYAQSAPAMAGRRDGGFLIAWIEGESALLARLYFRPDQAHEWHHEICALGDGCGPPAVGNVRRGDGEHYLVAYRRGHNGPIMGIWIDPDQDVGGPFEISAGGQCSDPTVALLADEFVVVWTQDVDGTSAVFARVVRGNGEFGQMPTGNLVTSAPLRVSPEGRGDCHHPAVATPRGFDGASTAMVFYRDVDGADGQGPDIARRLVRVVRADEGP